ncbi:hypothetical protein GTG23_31495 [Rhodococcus hoagii]|nr:hypothetical protein [Prescottella equi]
MRLLEVDAEPRQLVDTTLDDTPEYVDLRSEPDPRAAALAWMRADYSAPVDLLRDRLVVAAVLHVEDGLYYWYNRAPPRRAGRLRGHHVREPVAELYSADVDGVEPSPNVASPLEKVYDADRTYRSSTRFTTDRDYWLERVAGSRSPRVSPAGPRRPRR